MDSSAEDRLLILPALLLWDSVGTSVRLGQAARHQQFLSSYLSGILRVGALRSSCYGQDWYLCGHGNGAEKQLQLVTS